jgi:hypothetical protein
MNPVSPDRLTRAERLDEVARLLALAILRRRERMRMASDSPKKGLEFLGDVRLHVTPEGGGS